MNRTPDHRTRASAFFWRQFGQNIVAIDSNPLVLDVVRAYGVKHGSRLYERSAVAGLARTKLASSTTKFDLIDLSIMGSLPSVLRFFEDYRPRASLCSIAPTKPDVPRLIATSFRRREQSACRRWPGCEASGISDFRTCCRHRAGHSRHREDLPQRKK
jgi:hypothetical protein